MAYAGIKLDPTCAALNRAQTTFQGPESGDEYAHVHVIDADGNAMFARGNTVPTDTSKGFAPGCIFIDFNATGPMIYENTGTATSCAFTKTFAKALAPVGTITETTDITGTDTVDALLVLAAITNLEGKVNSIITTLGGT